MEIETMSIDELVPYERNVNVHTVEQVEQIAESIEEFGFRDPVGVWTDADGRLEIVEGHGRVMAAKQLGISEVPVIRLDDLTDAQRRAYAIVHNQLTRNSEFDQDLLELELGELDDLDFDLDWDDLGLARVDIDFADFDGSGDGGGSQMARGTKVRVVIGALIFDLDDPTHEIYAKTKELDAETVGAFLAKAILNDRMAG